MALESTTCGIVHHARRTRAHCPTMVSSFKLSSGTVCLLGFSCRAGHIRKGKTFLPFITASITTPYITTSGHTACVMHNAVPTSAVLHLVGTTNLIIPIILIYLGTLHLSLS